MIAEAKSRLARHRKPIAILVAIWEALGISCSSPFFLSFSRLSILVNRLQLALDRNTFHYYLLAMILNHDTWCCKAHRIEG